MFTPIGSRLYVHTHTLKCIGSRVYVPAYMLLRIRSRVYAHVYMFIRICSCVYAHIRIRSRVYAHTYVLYRQTFRMLNVRPLHKTMRNCSGSTSGFPLLEELCIATTSHSYMTDKDLQDILFNSNNLRVLDLRGCSRITPTGLARLPCNGRKRLANFVNISVIILIIRI